MENKKGQQMTLGTIIAIVRGLVVLVFLIYGFSTGWGNLWDKVTGLGGGDVNIDTMKTSCTLACQQDNRFGVCNQSRTIIINDSDSGRIPGNCSSFADAGYVTDCTPITC